MAFQDVDDRDGLVSDTPLWDADAPREPGEDDEWEEPNALLSPCTPEYTSDSRGYCV